MLRMKVVFEIDKTDEGYAIAAIVTPRHGITSSAMFHSDNMDAAERLANDWALKELKRLEPMAGEGGPDPLSVDCTLCLSPAGKPCVQLTQTTFSTQGSERKIAHASRRDKAAQMAGDKLVSERTPLPYPRSGPHVQPRIGMKVRRPGSSTNVEITDIDHGAMYFSDDTFCWLVEWSRGEWLVPPQ